MLRWPLCELAVQYPPPGDRLYYCTDRQAQWLITAVCLFKWNGFSKLIRTRRSGSRDANNTEKTDVHCTWSSKTTWRSHFTARSRVWNIKGWPLESFHFMPVIFILVKVSFKKCMSPLENTWLSILINIVETHFLWPRLFPNVRVTYRHVTWHFLYIITFTMLINWLS